MEFDFLRKLFEIPKSSLGPFWQRNRWGKKRKVGRHEGIIKSGFFAKAAYRCYMRAKYRPPAIPAAPTRKSFMSSDGRRSYRVWSDGSIRVMKATGKRKLVAV